MSELIIGNGLCGNAVYETLSANGADVYQASRRPDKLNGHAYYVDMLDQDSVSAVLQEVQPDVIINTAAILGRRGDQNLLSSNAMFASNLLEGARTLEKSPRIVMLGSAAVYGETEVLPVPEAAPMKAQDPYGVSKRLESVLSRTLADAHGLDVVEARLGNILSPMLPESYLSSVILQQMDNIRSGKQEQVVSMRSTENMRDYTDLKNVVDGILHVAYAPDMSASVYNIASGEATTNGELARMLLQHGNMSDVEVRATDEQPEPRVGAAHVDISRLRATGWEPRVSLDETAASLVNARFWSDEGSQQAVA
jgi:nucleoside-diphosphate-sugar epimerase